MWLVRNGIAVAILWYLWEKPYWDNTIFQVAVIFWLAVTTFALLYMLLYPRWLKRNLDKKIHVFLQENNNTIDDGTTL